MEMNKAYIERTRKFYEDCYKEDNEDVVAVVSQGKPGVYQDNPTIKEYEQKGYYLIDANIFGCGDARGEILIFEPKL